MIRVVKMTFKPENVDTFLAVFNESKELIRNFPGVQHLELLNDKHQSNIYFTYSIWDQEESLENYRNSELFKSVWKKTKPLFESKAEAWSVEQIVKLP